ncbi:MAG: hypothetical protein BHW25_00055 [Faecalibacterium sp. CAG:82-related_59_9]|nr:MAG: hypothetical protein BHW25_00055 [Faecalibacterium sp. CAG:82-related_59_9]
MLTFGSAYELYTDDEEFLVIPYRQIVESLPETTQEIAREYDLKCYVANNGLYLDAVLGRPEISSTAMVFCS